MGDAIRLIQFAKERHRINDAEMKTFFAFFIPDVQ
jgi:hypothetical protein